MILGFSIGEWIVSVIFLIGILSMLIFGKSILHEKMFQDKTQIQLKRNHLKSWIIFLLLIFAIGATAFGSSVFDSPPPEQFEP